MSKLGRVRYFNPSKQYGFMDTDCFFHHSYGGSFVFDGDDFPLFVKGIAGAVKAGDVLVYQDEDGPQSKRATWWGFLSELEQVKEQIAARKLLRLVERKGPKADSELYREGVGLNEIIWEGVNTFELRKRFPLTRFPLIERSDYALFLVDALGNPVEDPR